MKHFTVKGKGGIEASIVLGTKGLHKPIYTFKIKFHRYCAEQFLKHRMFSCNAVSSRALSVPKMNKHIEDSPAEPLFWGAQVKGMQPSVEHKELVTKSDGVWGSMDHGNIGGTAQEVWDDAKLYCMQIADALWDAGYHQQIPNRLTHAFQMAEYIVTATDLNNFFNLRLHDKAAQSEINEVAKCMREAVDKYELQRPVYSGGNFWHLPYITNSESSAMDIKDLLKLSAARCAVISYNNHRTSEPMTLESANKIYNHLISDTNPHLTPMEHSARMPKSNEQLNYISLPTDCPLLKRQLKSMEYYANMHGWITQRYLLELGV